MPPSLPSCRSTSALRSASSAARALSCSIATADAISTSAAGSRSRSSATPTRIWWRPSRRRPRSSGTARTSTASSTRSSWPSGWSRSRSPTPCSSATPAPRRSSARSRWRAASSISVARRSASGSSPSRAHSTAARWRPSRPAARRRSRGLPPRLPGFDHVPLGDLARVEAAIGPETAAILVEPIQGEGGIRAAAAGLPGRAAPARATSTTCC